MENFKFALHILVRPFDGFWDMKNEKAGKLRTALLIVLGVALTLVFERRATAFLFNPYKRSPLNIFMVLRSVIMPYILFCVGNWAVTTLMDGEGKMVDILMAVGYALLPMILIRIPLAIITNFLTFEELSFVRLAMSVATYWTYFLIFVGVMTVHQYGLFKTIVTILITLVACGAMLFIGVLFFNLIWQMVGFFGTMVRELNLRLR